MEERGGRVFGMGGGKREGELCRSKNGIGPDGGKALAAPLERLTTLQTLDLRFVEGVRYRGWEVVGS